MPDLVFIKVLLYPGHPAVGLVPLLVHSGGDKHDRRNAHDPHVDADPHPRTGIVDLVLGAQVGDFGDAAIVVLGEVVEGVACHPSCGGDVA